MELESRVLVDEVEQLPRAQHEAENDFARLQVLALAIDDTGFDQRNHIVGNHLGVNAEILPVHQVGQDGIGNCSNPTL